MSMFCYQCQEALNNKGCVKIGVCGKTSEVANLQDLLIFSLKGIAVLNLKAREKGINREETDKFLIEGLFSTVTNVNFDKKFFLEKIKEAVALRDGLKAELKKAGVDVAGLEKMPAVAWTYSSELDLEALAPQMGVLATADEDKRSLRELVIYGLKGIAAYAFHAYQLGFKDEAIFRFVEKALAATLDEEMSVDQYVALVLETGKYGVETMALLDRANTSTYGHPEINKVDLGVRNNPGILISGHDLRDLEELLEQTAGTGVDVYTHGEMLPAQYYPAFKKYPHFAGNYGNSWWLQYKEFDTFNGPILMTSNCLVPPRESYKDRVYTTGVVGFSGLKHIPERADGKKDFSEIIEQAKKCQPPVEIEKGEIVGGFAHHQVMQLADKVVGAVMSGAIRRFFVMAGCDGRMKNREYYTEFARALPKDTVILTAGCAKFRYNKLGLGEIGGIPRVLDAGQCNDSYSLAFVALKLKEVLGLDDINRLPISYNIAWYEQKAVIVLLALLSLGIKNIHLGPTLPAFLSPNVGKVLVEKFGIAGVGTVEDDLKLFLGA
ncbi:MAG: hydroxylamine reductase [Candidatus Saccharicenans sp.]|nr:hydroxylamine reductase [Candidatus Saccharicenans sp.]